MSGKAHSGLRTGSRAVPEVGRGRSGLVGVSAPAEFSVLGTVCLARRLPFPQTRPPVSRSPRGGPGLASAARHARSWPCALSVPSARLSPGAAPRETGRLRGGRAGARAPSSSSASERAGACSGGGLQWLIETRCKITTTFLVTYCNDLPRFGLRFY